MKIKNVVVIGSGTMGSGIAAHLCNANIPVTLLDLKTEISQNARERIHKSRPPLLIDKTKIDNIKVGNISDDLEGQIISPENFEVSPNAGLPQQETTFESNDLVEEDTQEIDGPIEEALDGSPAQGIQSLDQSTIESNEESTEIAPQETEVLSVTEENNSEVIDNQLEIVANHLLSHQGQVQ